MIADSISSLPENLQGLFWTNIGLIGGNVKFEGFGRRLCVVIPLICIQVLTDIRSGDMSYEP